MSGLGRGFRRKKPRILTEMWASENGGGRAEFWREKALSG